MSCNILYLCHVLLIYCYTRLLKPKEYNQCVDAYADAVYRFVLSHLRLADSAQDVVQDAFVRLWEKHEKVEAAKAKTYLFTTAYHCMIDMLRKNKRLHFTDDMSYNTMTNANPEPDLQTHLHRALARLPEIQRSVVLLRDYEGYAYEEIGEICGLKASQVKVYIFRARSKMKAYIGEMNKLI